VLVNNSCEYIKIKYELERKLTRKILQNFKGGRRINRETDVLN